MPAASQRAGSFVHSGGRYSRLSTKARPRGPTWARKTPTWQLATLPNTPQYWRATPTDYFPCLGKPLLSTAHTARGVGQLGSQIGLQMGGHRGIVHVFIPAGWEEAEVLPAGGHASER